MEVVKNVTKAEVTFMNKAGKKLTKTINRYEEHNIDCILYMFYYGWKVVDVKVLEKRLTKCVIVRNDPKPKRIPVQVRQTRRRPA